MTADDFVYGVRRILDPKTASSNSFILFPFLKNAEQVTNGTLPLSAAGIEAPDPHTVVIRLSHPWPLLPLYAGGRALWPEPRKAIERWGDAWTKPGHFLADGPYTLVDWRLGDAVVLRKNPPLLGRGQGLLQRGRLQPVDRCDLQRARRQGRRSRRLDHRAVEPRDAAAPHGPQRLPAGRAAVRRHLPVVQHARAVAEGRAGPPGALDGDRPRLHHPEAAARRPSVRLRCDPDRRPRLLRRGQALLGGVVVRAPAGGGPAAAGGGRLRTRPPAEAADQAPQQRRPDALPAVGPERLEGGRRRGATAGERRAGGLHGIRAARLSRSATPAGWPATRSATSTSSAPTPAPTTSASTPIRPTTPSSTRR